MTDKWLALLTVMIGAIASILSSTTVNVAIPELSRYFVLGQARAQWVSAGFMLSMTLSMLTTPWLLSRFGLRRTYTGAILLLMAGGVAGGFSFNYPMLLAMRVVEGLAAGVMQPIPTVVILQAFNSKEQGKAMGVFGFGAVLAPAVGPSVGGFLVQHFGWRSIFFVVIPCCLVVLAMIRRFLVISSPAASEARSLDWKGLLLVCICVVSMLNGLVYLRTDWLPAFGLLTLGLICLAMFIVYQLHAESPLMSMQLFGHRRFAMGGLVAFIYGMGLYGSTYLLPNYLQMALQYSPSKAGLTLLPAGIALAVTIPLAGKMADRFEPNILVMIGLALLALSFGLIAMAFTASDYLVLTLWILVGRIGLGFILPALSVGAMRGIEAGMIIQASSAFNFVMQLGGAIGVSLVGIVLEWRLLVHHTGVEQQASRINQIIAPFHETFWFVTIICAMTIFAARRMKDARA